MLKTKLLEHQIQALDWMKSLEIKGKLHNSRSGGILADDMGLGKTLTCISLILDNIEQKKIDNNNKLTLIITPLSLVASWKYQIKLHTHLNEESIFEYRGTHRYEKLKQWLLNSSLPCIVIATYETIRSDHGNKKNKTIRTLNLYHLKWDRIILDEAHKIKTSRSKTQNAICSLKSNRRWCITGTPLQNTIDDIYSLAKFIGIHPYDDKKWWTQQHNVKKSAKKWLKFFSMSRGKSILSLPEKKEIKIEIDLNDQEKKFYNKLYHYALKNYSEYNANSKYNKNRNAITWIIRLRQCCNHPLMVFGKNGIFAAAKQKVLNKPECFCYLLTMKKQTDCIGFCKKASNWIKICPQKVNGFEIIASSKIQRIIEICSCFSIQLKKKIILFSQWVSFLDLIGEFLTRENMIYLKYDGSIKNLQDRNNVIEKFREDNSTYILLCSYSCGAVGINLQFAEAVFLIDQSYNPSIEHQAIDRVHRIGQINTVFALKCIVKNTVEMDIQTIQTGKNEIVADLLNKPHLPFQHRQTKKEREGFNTNHHKNFKSNANSMKIEFKTEVYSKKRHLEIDEKHEEGRNNKRYKT